MRIPPPKEFQELLQGAKGDLAIRRTALLVIINSWQITRRNESDGPSRQPSNRLRVQRHVLIATCSHFEGYKSGQNRGRIELANDAFEIAKTSRQRVDGNDIAVTCRCQGNKAEIKK